MLATLFLPAGNRLPPSFYLMKQIMDVRDISSIEWHSCEAGCTGWEPTPKAEWHKHKDDCCPKCNGRRFKSVLGKDVPVRRFWFVAPEDSIKELFADPAFVKALLEARVVNVGSFADSEEFRRLNKAVGGVLSSSEHGIIELGFDFAQPYNFLQHSTGFMFMRYGSLPNGGSARREWHKLVLCIEGPMEPSVLDAFLQPVAEAAGDAATPEHGIMVTPAVRDSSGAIILGAAFLHFAVLGGIYADSPAAAALRYSIKSFTAYFSCAFCKLVGTMCDGTVRFCGYIKPVLTPAGAGQGRSYQMGAQDGRLLSDLEQRAQATAAAFNRARGFEPPHGNRFKGFSPLLRLYWVRVSSLFVVPFSHAFHLGIFKGLISSMFAKESKQQDGTAAANPLRISNDARHADGEGNQGRRLHVQPPPPDVPAADAGSAARLDLRSV
ncbi:hypothetical protein OEZ86_008001 [Tetradesmus obliquus]|nr:hypothetical protein OEZ86_008001 [Tetradesmus obliquus]